MPFLNRKRRVSRWFFATDIHGSDRCYRKFLAAAAVYKADVLVLGGDVAGKGIVPLVETGTGHTATFQGRTEQVVAADELEVLERRINFNGLYPYRCTAAQADALGDAQTRAGVFDDLIASQVRSWAQLTEERLDDRVRCIVTPGNDDPRVVDAELATAARLESPEAEVVEVGPVLLASLGNTTPTPWHTDREYAEDELAAQIDSILRSHVDAARPFVFNFHCPPLDSGLDSAPALDEELRPVVANGQVVHCSAGSLAVREAIERHAPTVGLHGHIHESQGRVTIGRSRCFNPGSDYSSGVLKGVIVDFDAGGSCLSYLFTTG